MKNMEWEATKLRNKAINDAWKRGRRIAFAGVHRSLSTRGERGETWRTKKWTPSRCRDLPKHFARHKADKPKEKVT